MPENKKYYSIVNNFYERRSNNIHSGIIRNNSDIDSDRPSEGIQTTSEKV